MVVDSRDVPSNEFVNRMDENAQLMPERILRRIAVAIFFAVSIPLFIHQFYPLPPETLLWIKPLLPAPIVILLALQSRKKHVAAWLTVILLWGAATVAVLRYSGVGGAPATAYILVTFLAAVILPGRRWLIVFELSLFVTAAMAYAQYIGMYAPIGYVVGEEWAPQLIQLSLLLAVGALIHWSSTGLQKSFQEVQLKNNELEEQHSLLEQRSAEISATSARLQLESQQRRQSMEKLRETEVALRASEKRYRTVFDHDPNAVVIADLLSQQIVDVNSSATRLFGYQHDQMLELTMPELSPDAQPDWVNNDADLLAIDKATFHDLSMYEWVFEKSYGEQFPAEVRMVRLPASGSDRQLFQMSIVDITERHYALRALRESEARYRTIVENAPDAILIVDADKHCLVDVNENAVMLFGRSRVELLAGDVESVMPLDSAETGYQSFIDVADAICEGGHAAVEFTRLDAEGQEVTLEAHIVKLPAGDRKLLRASITDVTRRRVAEDMVSALPGCVSVVSLDGDVMWANASFTERFELPADRLSGVSIRRFVGTEDYDNVVAELRDQSGKRAFTLDVQSSGGRQESVDAVVSLIEFRSRPAVLMLVADAARPNGSALMVEPASGIVISDEDAEEMQNLAGVMVNQATIAISKLDTNDVARGHIERSLEAAKRFVELGRDSFGEPKGSNIAVTPVELNKLIDKYGDLFELTISPHLSIDYVLSPGLPEIHADGDLMKRMLAGLVINAAEAIGNEPGLIVIETKVVEISAESQSPYIMHTGTLLKPGRYVAVSVDDNGSGFNSAALRRLFDPSSGGSAARLSAIVRVVRGHRGGLKVTSEEGHGSSFTAVFPAVTSAVSYPAD